MQSIIYASRAVERFDATGLDALLTQARARNAADGVTGLLLYAEGSFLQLLEGGAPVLDATYARIAADPRHAGLRLLARDDLQERLLGDWSMGFHRVDPATLPGYREVTSYPLLNPDLVHDAAVARMLLRLYSRQS